MTFTQTVLNDYMRQRQTQPFNKKKSVSSKVKDQDKKKVKNQQELARRVRRFKPGTVAVREIKKYQSYTRPLLLRGSFQRLVRSIV